MSLTSTHLTTKQTLITTFACSTHATTTTSSDDDNNNPLLSKNLRTYWATTIPLTVLLLIFWLVWRHRATRVFQSNYASIQRGRDTINPTSTHQPQKAPSPSPSPRPTKLPPPPPTASSTRATTSGTSKERTRVTMAEVDVEDGRSMRERGGYHRSARSHVSALLMPSSSHSHASERPTSSMSTWPTGPSGVSAPQMAGDGRRGKGREQQQEDVERLV